MSRKFDERTAEGNTSVAIAQSIAEKMPNPMPKTRLIMKSPEKLREKLQIHKAKKKKTCVRSVGETKGENVGEVCELRMRLWISVLDVILHIHVEL